MPMSDCVIEPDIMRPMFAMSIFGAGAASGASLMITSTRLFLNIGGIVITRESASALIICL
jgi:hypothetical protein